jgi:RNA polymerase sigma factor (sigma-70 family)
VGRGTSMSESVNLEIQNNVKMAAEVFDEYGDAIRAIIKFNVKSETEIDDIFQEFFLSIVRRPIPQSVEDIRGYLYKAVTNDIIDISRRTKSDRNRINRYAECRKYSINEEEPENIVIKAEEIQKVFQTIENNLPKREAEVVVKRYSRNLNTTDTAQRMSVNKRTVSRYLSVAVKKARQIIHKYGDDLP